MPDEGYEKDARELGLGFVILGALAFVANFCQSALLNISAIRQAPKAKAAYLQAVLRQDVSWFDTNNVGVAGRLSSDASEIQDAIGEKLGMAVQSIAQFFAGIFVGFFISWRLSLVVIAIVPPLAIALALLMYIVGNVQAKISAASAGGVSLSQEALAAVRTVVSFTLQEHITELYSVEAENMRAGAAEIGKSANMGESGMPAASPRATPLYSALSSSPCPARPVQLALSSSPSPARPPSVRPRPIAAPRRRPLHLTPPPRAPPRLPQPSGYSCASTSLATRLLCGTAPRWWRTGS